MKIDFAFLADAAEESKGKLYVVGGAIDTIWTQSVPAVHPRISLALRLLISPGELGRSHQLEISLMDGDGKRVAAVKGQFEPDKNQNLSAGWEQGMLLVLNVPNLQFQKFGDYQFDIMCNNSSLKTVPLRVAQQIPLDR